VAIHRLRALLTRPRLDERLAGGAAVANDPVLARRAAQLRAPRARRRVAAALQRALSDLRPGLTAAVPVDRSAVTYARPYLVELIDVLRSSSEVAPQGVARAARLLTDVASPLYPPARPSDLLGEVRLTLFWLDPAPSPCAEVLAEAN
jgi:hypothetical protein